MTQPAAPKIELSIDVFSDVVCPWCLIGTRRLDQALAQRPDVHATIEFHPFVLDPSTPPEGADLREHLRKKYGMNPESMFGRVESAARESGIPLDFSKVRRSVRTTSAHALLDAALPKGTQRALKAALLDAYFLDGIDVGNEDELVKIASKHGFSEDEARAAVRDESRLARVRAEAAAASRQGINGVPFFVFGGKLAFSGAQPVDTFLKVIDRAVKEAAAATPHP